MTFWNLVEMAHGVTPYFVVTFTGLVTIGFVQILFRAEGVVRYLTLGFLLLYIKVLLRTTYWDVLPGLVGEPRWSTWLILSHGNAVNAVFHSMVIVACYFSLKAILYSIPATDRRHFNLLTAAFYRRSPNAPDRPR